MNNGCTILIETDAKRMVLWMGKLRAVGCVIVIGLILLNTTALQVPTGNAAQDNLPVPTLQNSTSQNISAFSLDLIRSARNSGNGSISQGLTIGLMNSITPTEYCQLLSKIADAGGAVLKTVRSDLGRDSVALKIDLPLQLINSDIEQMKRMGFVKYIEPDYVYKLNYVPDDTYWSSQWGMRKIQADWAWNTTVGNHNILVAVVDTGIDANHPDLAANFVPLGYNWVNSTKNTTDDNGHGTHCAGIIAAQINNHEGVAGLAQVRIMAEKAFNADGNGTSTDIASAIYNATDAGARIISMSFGSYQPSSVVHDAIKYASDHGVLLVAAAGNDGEAKKMYPASFDEVISVAATNYTDTRALFSDYGDSIELSAPGVNIYSTLPTYPVTMTTLPNGHYNADYDNVSGTSMACPFVAGLAALVLCRYPNMTRDQLRYYLRATADQEGRPGFDPNYGYGRINAKKAIEQGLPLHDLAITKLEEPATIRQTATMKINATVLNFGLSNETNVQVQLWRNSSLLNTTTIPVFGSGTQIKITWNVYLQSSEVYNLTAFVIPKTGESSTQNNKISGWVQPDSGVLRVPQQFAHIQEAVDAAVAGDKILVDPGTYNESVTINNEGISLLGHAYSDTIINCRGTDSGSGNLTEYQYGIVIAANDIVVSGFTVMHALGGINVEAYNDSVSGNYLIDNAEGVELLGASHCFVSRNLICSSNDCGILSDGGGSNNISGNSLNSNGNMGIALIVGTNNNVSNNSIVSVQNFNGIFVLDSDSTISGNYISLDQGLGYNSWLDLYGFALELYFPNGCIIKNNYIKNNSRGIDSRDYVGNPNPNWIFHDNVINNSIQLSSVGLSHWCDRWSCEGNYWSNYAGTDGNGDGIGDTPYMNTDLYPLMKLWFTSDVNHDGSCNVQDLTLATNANGSRPGNSTWNPHVDINQDGVINNVDISQIQANLGLNCTTYWNSTLTVGAKDPANISLNNMQVRIDNQSTGYTVANFKLQRGPHEVYIQPTLQNQYHNYTFSHWNDGSTKNQEIYILNSTTTITAYYNCTNLAPNTPSQPSGTASGYVYTNYNYTTSATDPNSDNINYKFYWNDSTSSIVGPYTSGAMATATHQWTRPGSYQIKVRAQDVYGAWSTSNSTAKTVTIGQNDANLYRDAGNSNSSADSVTPTLSFQGTLYQSNPTDTQDWYKFYAGKGQTIYVTMTPPSGVNFDLQLYFPNGTLAKSSTLGAGQTDYFTYKATISGDWRIRIYITSGEGQYTAYISVTGIGPQHPGP